MAKELFMTFFEKVKEMRKAQKAFFDKKAKGSKQAILIQSKTLESEVDQIIRTVQTELDKRPKQ